MKDLSYKQAIEILNEIDWENHDQELALNMAIQELNKYIPKEPIQPKDKIRYGMGYDYHDYYCPTCGEFLEPEPKGNRLKEESALSKCGCCNQKIKWEKQ